MRYILLLLLHFSWADSVMPHAYFSYQWHSWTDLSLNHFNFTKKYGQGRTERAPYQYLAVPMGLTYSLDSQFYSLEVSYSQFIPSAYHQTDPAIFSVNYRYNLAYDSIPAKTSYFNHLMLGWGEKNTSSTWGIKGYIPLQTPAYIDFASKSQALEPGYAIEVYGYTPRERHRFQASVFTQLYADKRPLKQLYKIQGEYQFTPLEHLHFIPANLIVQHQSRNLQANLGDVAEFSGIWEVGLGSSSGAYNLGIELRFSLYSFNYGNFDIGTNEWIDADRYAEIKIGKLY